MKTCKMLPAEIILHQAVLRNATEFQHSHFRGTKQRSHSCPECSSSGEAPEHLSPIQQQHLHQPVEADHGLVWGVKHPDSI